MTGPSCSHATELDTLVQLAIVRAQFEIIHPFGDGNGRPGRLLIPLFLCEKKVLQSPKFFLSESLELHRKTYEHSLRVLGNAHLFDDRSSGSMYRSTSESVRSG